MKRPFGLFKLAVSVYAGCLSVSIPAHAEEAHNLAKIYSTLNELKTKVESQEARIEALEDENKMLRTQSAAEPAPQVHTAKRSSTLSAFNPEIGLVADITGISTESDEDAEGNDKLSVREVEIVFGHDIDPYSRFDSTFTLSDFEDPEIEEAYITHFGLPANIKMRLGRLRPKIGKASASHRDQLDTVDEPFVVQQFLGVEGLFKTSAEFSSFLPLGSESFVQELTAGVMEGGAGEGGNIFGETKRRPSLYAHLKNFWEISDSSDFELGGTYLHGSSDEDSKYEVNGYGLDTTLVHYFNATNKLKLQGEIYLQDRDEAALVEEDGAVPFDDNLYGFYALADYRLSPRFGIGGRFDRVEPVNLDQGTDDTLAYTGYLTFYQSEFARWRAQYQFVDLPNGEDDNRFFLQSTIAIGVHKHQLQ